MAAALDTLFDDPAWASLTAALGDTADDAQMLFALGEAEASETLQGDDARSAQAAVFGSAGRCLDTSHAAAHCARRA